MKMNRTDVFGIAAIAYFFQLHPDNEIRVYLYSDNNSDDETSESFLMKDYFDVDQLADEYLQAINLATMHCPPPKRVLDIGCGTGRFSQYFKEKGYDVVGIDTSVGAIWVCNQRGIRNTRVVDIKEITRQELGNFDILLLLGNTIGIGGTPNGVREILHKASTLANRKSLLLVNSVDVERIDADELPKGYRKNEYPGQIRYRLCFGPYVSDWFWWIQVKPNDLAAWASDFGWKMIDVFTRPDAPWHWSGVLEKLD